jgi:hypothetical protein
VIRSAALGGLFIGVLSALPVVGAANCCCCLWIVSGGGLAAYLEAQQRNRTLTGGEGAAVGALAGVIGALVWLPIVAIVALVLGPFQEAILEEIVRNARDMRPEAREILENMGSSRGIIGFILLFLFSAGRRLDLRRAGRPAGRDLLQEGSATGNGWHLDSSAAAAVTQTM